MSTAPLKRSLQNLEFLGQRLPLAQRQTLDLRFFRTSKAQQLSAEVFGCGVRRCEVFERAAVVDSVRFYSRP
jgi:hypothetical protein